MIGNPLNGFGKGEGYDPDRLKLDGKSKAKDEQGLILDGGRAIMPHVLCHQFNGEKFK